MTLTRHGAIRISMAHETYRVSVWVDELSPLPAEERGRRESG
jgi:hypothetical protein